jgi:dCTP deaminase
MSTLTKTRLLSRMGDPESAEPSEGDRRLIVTPLLSRKQINDASIDVRLGNQFIVFRSHTLQAYSPSMPSDTLRQMQDRQVLRFGACFILHPGTLALASTLEYVRMPSDLEAQVEGRSSWARVGLAVATATVVEPGFRGVVTLELSNVGTIPLEITPGVRIAQLVFRDATPGEIAAYTGPRKYQCPVGPQFSRLHEDKDTHVFRPAPREK